MIAALAALALILPQADARLDAAHKAAKRCAEATIKGDFKTVAGLTHPKIVERLGGREKMLETMEKGQAEMTRSGVTFEKAEVSAPERLIADESALYCVIRQDLRIKVPNGRLLVRGSVIGVSDDDGKTWTFIDASPGEEKIRGAFPELPKDLDVPPGEQKFEPDEDAKKK